ncbi:MAG: zf-HC2 domain-containing protein [Inconstantimicrobium porci]|uniref:zf-HC2 domain-containing protein n=1 Tax=Inconstantimicrobium porci TaxID=2652291 RepID=UPI002A9089B6|nr:zf-HC2 domain-containing protein [Inconstantimicrobium porci]MDY5911663.1 zf-HC2 domain-containing protein [Inconstantimicrobium porci]
MENISCDVCIDLMMLVKDNAASDDSIKLVNKHISECEECRRVFEEDREALERPINDSEILKRIKRRISIITVIMLVIGTLTGVVLTNSMGMFYNFIIMPLIGGIGYILLNKKWYYVSIFIAVTSYIGNFVQNIMESVSIQESLIGAVYFTAAYTFCCSLR